MLKDATSGGIRVARELHDNFRQAKSIILLDSSEGNPAVEAFRSGASGVFPRGRFLRTVGQVRRKSSRRPVLANSQQLKFAMEHLRRASPGTPFATIFSGFTTSSESERASNSPSSLGTSETSQSPSYFQTTRQGCTFPDCRTGTSSSKKRFARWDPPGEPCSNRTKWKSSVRKRAR